MNITSYIIIFFIIITLDFAQSEIYYQLRKFFYTAEDGHDNNIPMTGFLWELKLI